MNRRGFLGRLVAAPVAGLLAWKVAPRLMIDPACLPLVESIDHVKSIEYAMFYGKRRFVDPGYDYPLDGLTFRS